MGIKMEGSQITAHSFLARLDAIFNSLKQEVCLLVATPQLPVLTMLPVKIASRLMLGSNNYQFFNYSDIW